MKRILLCLDDYTDLVLFEPMLKKVGFDVVGVQNDVVLAEQLMSFNPDLVIMTALGKRVNGVKGLAKIKARPSQPKVLLVAHNNRHSIPPDRLISGILDTPVQPRLLLEFIAGLFDLDEELLLQKYERVAGEQGPSVVAATGASDVKAVSSSSAAQNNSRSEHYKKMAQSQPLPPFQGFKKEQVRDQVKEFRAFEKTPEVEAIDKERKAFAVALGKKAKSRLEKK